jgi:hypothetical protein
MYCDMNRRVLDVEQQRLDDFDEKFKLLCAEVKRILLFIYFHFIIIQPSEISTVLDFISISYDMPKKRVCRIYNSMVSLLNGQQSGLWTQILQVHCFVYFNKISIIQPTCETHLTCKRDSVHAFVAWLKLWPVGRYLETEKGLLLLL